MPSRQRSATTAALRCLAAAAAVTFIATPASADRKPRTFVIEGKVSTYPFCSLASADQVKAALSDRALKKARRLVVRTAADGMRALVKSRRLRRIRTLEVCTDNEGLAVLARQWLPRLESLVLTSHDETVTKFSPAAIENLVRSKLVRSIKSLTFVAGDSEAERSIDTVGMIEMALHARMPKLRRLNLRYNPASQDALVALLSARWTKRLTHLNLCKTDFGPRAADTLVRRAVQFTRLKYLCVSGKGDPRQSKVNLARVRAAYGSALDIDW